jgi:hypothetical protein
MRLSPAAQRLTALPVIGEGHGVASRSTISSGQQGGRREGGTDTDGHIQEAVRAATKDQRQPVMGEAESNDLVGAQIRV